MATEIDDMVCGFEVTLLPSFCLEGCVPSPYAFAIPDGEREARFCPVECDLEGRFVLGSDDSEAFLCESPQEVSLEGEQVQMFVQFGTSL